MHETLEGENWGDPVSLDEVVLEFILAESFKLGPHWQDLRVLFDDPNLKNLQENIRRREMLASIRGAIFQGVPHDTEWYLVRSLRNEHLQQLLVMGRCGWDVEDGSDRNELLRACLRRKTKEFGTPSS